MGSMEGKTCLVTGATSGIGRAAAVALARRGAEVLVAARDPGRGEAALREVRAAGGGRGRLLLADFADLAQVRRLAEEVRRVAPRLQVLVNDAGAIHMQRSETADGWETTFQVNHLAPFLLTRLLLDRLRESAPARIVTVASAAYAGVPGVDFEDLMGERGYAGFKAYSQSKLCNILFTRELARRLEGTRVAANCLHPGVVRTGFGRNVRGWLRWGVRLAGPLFLSAERGADTAVWLASSPEAEGASGGYFVRRRAVEPGGPARDAAAARRLWEVSERLLGPLP
jgi:NAD(P)-dependent dehydrogenase (short-subunit alcohol dehydrogenase family)